MRCHHGRFEIHRPVPVTMGDTWAVFLEPLERSKLNGPFYWLPVQSPNLCLLFLCHYVELQKTHHQDRLVSLILWATLKRLLCDGLCELGALGGGTKTRKVQIRAQISLLAARTDTELKWSNSVSLTILQTKLSQAGFPVRMNTDKWNHNPFWFGFFFPDPRPPQRKALGWFRGLWLGRLTGLILKNKSRQCRMTYFGRTSRAFVKGQADRKDVIKPWQKSSYLETNKQKFTSSPKRHSCEGHV